MDMRGYYEANRAADMLGIPVSVMVDQCDGKPASTGMTMRRFFIVSRKMHVRADGTAYLLQAGDFITINGGVSHEIYDGEPGDVQIICSIDSKNAGRYGGQAHLLFHVWKAAVWKWRMSLLIRQALSGDGMAVCGGSARDSAGVQESAASCAPAATGAELELLIICNLYQL